MKIIEKIINAFSIIKFQLRESYWQGVVNRQMKKHPGECPSAAASMKYAGATRSPTKIALEVIEQLAQMPKNSRLMDECFVKMCANYNTATSGDPIVFLRNLADELVFAGGCADVILSVIHVAIDLVPSESIEEAKLRRSNLRTPL